MPIRYDIYTENKNKPWIQELATARFGSFTIFTAEGSFQGVQEGSLIISVIDTEPSFVQQFAEEVKRWNEQQAVMIVTTLCDVQNI